MTLEHVHAALVRVGLEEEDVHTFDLTGPIVVGQVLSFDDEPQSNGKTIRWCQVDVGEDEPRGIVCGAHNFVVGDKVVVSLPGAVLPGPFPISARKTYGHTSDGMIASARELGLGDEHDGILRLQALGLDPEVGEDAIALLGLDDFAVEVNVTPDRGYAFSIRGIAREYANSTGAAFRDPAEQPALQAEIATRTAASGFEVIVDDAAPVRGRDGVTTFTTRHRARRERVVADAAVDGLALAARRHPLDLAHRRHRQLRDARARSADPHLRRREGRRAGSCCAARRRGRRSRRWTARSAPSMSRTSSSPTSPGRLGSRG